MTGLTNFSYTTDGLPMLSNNKSEVLMRVCSAAELDLQAAADIAETEYPWQQCDDVVKRTMNQLIALEIYIRDGFVDRYSGTKLVFPAALLVLAEILPAQFPAHENWVVSKTHPVFIDLWPVIDHVEPVARGGSNDLENLVTTSNIRNDIKSHWTLEELGWELKPAGKMENWDGLLSWFSRYVNKHPSLLEVKAIFNWNKTVEKFNSA